MEQRAQGTLRIWAEPFVPLRVPKLFNLRTDPFERADVTSNTYYDWFIDHAYLVLAATASSRVPARRSRSSRRGRRRRASRSTRWWRSSRLRSRRPLSDGRAARLLERRADKGASLDVRRAPDPRRACAADERSRCSTTTARSGARSRCRSRPTSSSPARRDGRGRPELPSGSPGRRRRAGLRLAGPVMVEHYAGDDTTCDALGGVVAAHAGISVDDFEAARGLVPALGAAPDARPRLWRVRVRADGRAAAVPGGERVLELHRLGRRPRLHAAISDECTASRPSASSGAHRARLRGRRQRRRRSAQGGGRRPRRRPEEAGADLEPHRPRPIVPSATRTATSRCSTSASTRTSRRCACSSSTTTPSASSTTRPGAEQALDERSRGGLDRRQHRERLGDRLRRRLATRPADGHRPESRREARSGWARTSTTPRRRPPTGRGRRVLDRPLQVTNPQFAPFVEETGYLTVAERPLDPADFPGAPAENLCPARSSSRGRAGPVDLRHLNQWWTWTPGACWRHPEGPAARSPAARITRSSTSPTRTPRRTPPGPGRRCRPRPSGSWPRAAASTGAPTPGATSRSRPASGSPTTGTATSPGEPTPGYGTTRRRLLPGQRLRPPRHGRQRLGVDERLVRRGTSADTEKPCCVPHDPRGGSEESLDPHQPQFRIPRKVIKGGRSSAPTATACATGRPPGGRRWSTPA